jgi:DNA-directed RNA polymerase specialized sigma24 family protein
MVRQSVLTQEALDTLLAWLDADRDAAGQKYEEIRHTLTRYFEWRHCIPADEYVDETITRVARRLAAGEQVRTRDPRSFFYGFAKHVYQESLKAQHPVDLSSVAPVRVEQLASVQLRCLEECLGRLAPQSRDLLEAYYLEGRHGLARNLGITPNALRLRVFKDKRKLRACVERCVAS